MHTIETETEADLIRRAQDGDMIAFEELIQRHHAGVVGVVLRMCGDASIADDAAQEAFIRAWKHLPRYKPQAPFRSWLYRIALNCAFSALRHEQATYDVVAPHVETLGLSSSSPSPEAEVARRERAALVRQAVLNLPPASRAALILREYQGFSYREISEALEIPMGTVMSRLNYARRNLRETLTPYMEGRGE